MWILLVLGALSLLYAYFDWRAFRVGGRKSGLVWMIVMLVAAAVFFYVALGD